MISLVSYPMSINTEWLRKTFTKYSSYMFYIKRPFFKINKILGNSVKKNQVIWMI